MALTKAVHMPRTEYPSQSTTQRGKDQVEPHKYTLAMRPLVGFAVDTIP